MNLTQLLAQQPVLLLDGAMGTELDKRGLMSRGRNNLDAPQAVLEIHQAYSRCGCDALTTNTLTANDTLTEYRVRITPEAHADMPAPQGLEYTIQGRTQVDVTLDSTGVAIGTYEALLCFGSNDPDEPMVRVPVTMEVVIPVELMSFSVD